MANVADIQSQTQIITARGYAVRTSPDAEFDARVSRLEQALSLGHLMIDRSHGPGGENVPPTGVSQSVWNALMNAVVQEERSLAQERARRSASGSASTQAPSSTSSSRPTSGTLARTPSGPELPPETEGRQKAQGFLSWLNPPNTPVYRKPWFIAAGVVALGTLVVSSVTLVREGSQP